MFGLTKSWEELPTKSEYLQIHTMERAICYKCGSDKLLDIGLTNVIDHRRKILCEKCKTPLYREED